TALPVLEQPIHCIAKRTAFVLAMDAAILYRTEPTNTRDRRFPNPEGAFTILKEQIHIMISKLWIPSKLIVLPTGKAFLSTDPKTSIKSDARFLNKVARDPRTARCLPRDNFHATKTEQAEFRSQPEIAIVTLGN